MNNITFNELDYLEANPDVAVAVSHGNFLNGFDHWQKFGIKSKRPLCTHAKLRAKKVFHLLDKSGLGLEIGPSHRPLAPKRAGFNVHILDHASATELRAKYQNANVDINNIEEVDFVWRGQPYSELIGQTHCYDWIISSHVIEHVPDLISHIKECELLLKPNGFLSLIIPDKRYCFDYFQPLTSTGNWLDAFAERRKKPTPGQVFDHIANTSKRKGNGAWGNDGLGGADSLGHSFQQAMSIYAKSIETPDYIDVHCWRFIPESFKLIIADLKNLGLIDLNVVLHFDTTGTEFYMTLAKTSENNIHLNRYSVLNLIRKSCFLENSSVVV